MTIYDFPNTPERNKAIRNLSINGVNFALQMIEPISGKLLRCRINDFHLNGKVGVTPKCLCKYPFIHDGIWISLDSRNGVVNYLQSLLCKV